MVKKRATKLVALFIVLSMILGVFSSCGGNTLKEENPPEKPTTWEDFTGAELENPDVKFSYFPTFTKLNKLYSIDYNFGLEKVYDKGTDVYGEILTLSALQGLIVKNGLTEGIYLNVLSCAGFADNFSQRWLDDMIANDGVTSEKVVKNTAGSGDETLEPFVQLVKKFSKVVKKTANNKPGYILYEQKFVDSVDPEGNYRKKGSQSVNAACTSAGVTGYLPVDKVHKELFDSLGFEQALDVSTWTEEDAFDAYKEDISLKLISLTPNAYCENRDLGIAVGMLFIDDAYSDSVFVNTKLQTKFPFNNGAVLMGWGSGNEVDQIRTDGAYGFGFICSVYNYNMTVFMSQGQKAFKQRNDEQEIKADPNKHYVAFLMSDGDNMSWHQNDFSFAKSYYGYSLDKETRAKNNFKMGWTTSPTMADATPNIMRYEYQKSSPFDYFYGGTSGALTIYPSTYGETNSQSLEKMAVSTDEYMRRADLEYTEILDDKVYDTATMNAFASKPNVKGGFVLANYDYYKQGGDIKWYNDKPFLGVAESYWGDTAGRVAHRLNSLPPSINTINGYTLMKVHCWTTSMSDLANMVSKLDDDIEIVSPGELIKMVDKNVPHKNAERTVAPDMNYPDGVDEYLEPAKMWEETPLNSKTEFNFDTYLDYEGWQKYIGSKAYDMITFSSEYWKYTTGVRTTADNGKGYSIRLDSGDYGLTDNTPGASLYSKLKVPDSDSAIFRYFSRGEGYGFDCDMRTRAIYKSGEGFKVELLKTGYEYGSGQVEWTENGDYYWKETVYNVAHLKGKEVIFVVEHNGSAGEGDGEIMYLDNISVGIDELNIDLVKQATKNTQFSTKFDTGVDGWNKYTTGSSTAEYDSAQKALKVVTTSAITSFGADAVWYTKFALPESKDFSHYKLGVNISVESGKTAKARLGMALPNGKVYRAGQYEIVDENGTYLMFDLDTFRVKGGISKYVYPFIEVSSNGMVSNVFIDNVDFAPWTRNLELGYYFDKEYMHNTEKSSLSSLTNINNWTLQSGRGLEDEAIIENNKIRLYGYDYMRFKEEELISKNLNNYAKVKNEYNARMFANVDIGAMSSLTFDVDKIALTKKNEPTTVAQYRVLFMENDGTILELKKYGKVGLSTTYNVTVDLSAVANKSGIIIVDFDVEGNAQRTGIYVSNIKFN